MTKTTYLPGNYPSWGAIQVALATPVYQYNGARGIVRNMLWSPGKIPEVDLTAIGYARPNTKLKALQRMYFNPVEAERMKALLAKRDGQAFSALCMSMRGGEKDSRSMGHCINAIAFTIGDDIRATVMYRSTELIKKFAADLAFIPWVFEQLEVKVDHVDFFFANAYLSGVFFPTLFRYHDPIEFLEMLRKKDQFLFVVATRFLRRIVKTEDQTFPYSPEQMQHVFAWKHFPKKMPTIRRYLEEHLGRIDAEKVLLKSQKKR